MVLDADPETVGQAVDRPFQAGVIKRDQAPALLAHEVVMVCAARVRPLESGLAVADRNPLNQPVLDQQVSDSVDAGPPGRPTMGAQLVLDLDRAKRARLGGEQVDDPLAGAAAL